MVVAAYWRHSGVMVGSQWCHGGVIVNGGVMVALVYALKLVMLSDLTNRYLIIYLFIRPREKREWFSPVTFANTVIYSKTMRCLEITQLYFKAPMSYKYNFLPLGPEVNVCKKVKRKGWRPT